ncbi:MAG TPA: alpha/beta fold hydrolase [Polyangiaceae bacterium]
MIPGAWGAVRFLACVVSNSGLIDVVETKVMAALLRTRRVVDGPFTEAKELAVAHWPAGSYARLAAQAGRYATVNELRMYYEVHGSGRPLVLLHGALETIEASFAKVVPALARTHRVIAVEQQAHGHTADIDRRVSYEQMADDTAELLRTLDVRETDVLGYSMGASVAFQLALRHPGLVRKLAIVAGCTNMGGYQPSLLEFMRNIDATREGWASHPLGPARRVELARDFHRTVRRPEQWLAALGRTKQAFDSYRELASDDLRSLRTDTLFVAGDDGVIRPEHASEVHRFVPNARLEMFPKTKHPEMVGRAMDVLPEFLNAPLPPLR